MLSLTPKPECWALASSVRYYCNNPLSATGETCSPELGKGENGFQLFWFKLFVFVILKPVWKRAGRGLVQKWGSHIFRGWPSKLLRISPSISLPETQPCRLGLQLGIAGVQATHLAYLVVQLGSSRQTWPTGYCRNLARTSDFGSLLQSHWREWDGSSVRFVTSGICPNITPFSPTCPEWSARCKIMCKAAQPCLLPSLSAMWGWVLGLTRKFPQNSAFVCR